MFIKRKGKAGNDLKSPSYLFSATSPIGLNWVLLLIILSEASRGVSFNRFFIDSTAASYGEFDPKRD
jgi:hypothetical protein